MKCVWKVSYIWSLKCLHIQIHFDMSSVPILVTMVAVRGHVQLNSLLSDIVHWDIVRLPCTTFLRHSEVYTCIMLEQ